MPARRAMAAQHCIGVSRRHVTGCLSVRLSSPLLQYAITGTHTHCVLRVATISPARSARLRGTLDCEGLEMSETTPSKPRLLY